MRKGGSPGGLLLTGELIFFLCAAGRLWSSVWIQVIKDLLFLVAYIQTKKRCVQKSDIGNKE